MEKNLAAITAKALTLIGERLDRMEARQIATDLFASALMEVHPDREAVLNGLERALDPSVVDQAKHPHIARAAQSRLRELLDAWRSDRPTETQT